jgi:cell division protein FtsL
MNRQENIRIGRIEIVFLILIVIVLLVAIVLLTVTVGLVEVFLELCLGGYK